MLQKPFNTGLSTGGSIENTIQGGNMKIYDLLWKKTDNDKAGKAKWERVGILMDREGKLSVKMDVIPASNWDGWLFVSERKD